MIGKYARGRTCVFIDAANIFYSERSLGWKVDYRRLKEYLESECIIIGLFFYTAKMEENPGQEAFLRKLSSLGYTIRCKEVKRISSGTYELRKGNMDIELALDAFRLTGNYDTMLLMSGDSDFAYLIDLLKIKGKGALVLSTRRHISVELMKRAKFFDMQRFKKYIFKEPRERLLR